MKVTGKIRAAREALQRLGLPKMVAARAALKRRTNASGTAPGPGPVPASGCAAKADRIQGYCRQDPTAALNGVPGFKRLTGHRIKPPTDDRFQAYGYVRWFQSRTSGMKFLIESARREAWLLPYRLTMYAGDKTGLLPDEVFGVLEVLPDFRMTMLEVAFDFAPDQINRKFVREHLLFGKSRPVPSIGTTDYFGTRKGAKRVQSYLKKIQSV